MSGMELRSEIKAHVENILDTFTGADGGAGFMALRWLLEQMDRKAADGDAPAEEILTVVRRMSRLIDSAKKAMARR